MAPGKHKKNTQTGAGKKNAKESFPGLKVPSGPLAASIKTQYQEVQENELIALEAIYGDDFVPHASTHSAWKVRP